MVPKAKFAPLEVGSIPRQVNLFARIFPTWANLSRFFSLLLFAVQDCRITFTSNRVIRCEHFHNFYLLFILPEEVHLSEIMRQSDAWNLFLQMHDAQRRKKKNFSPPSKTWRRHTHPHVNDGAYDIQSRRTRDKVCLGVPMKSSRMQVAEIDGEKKIKK